MHAVQDSGPCNGGTPTGVALLTSASITETLPGRYAQRLISTVILDHIKLAVRVNHHKKTKKKHLKCRPKVWRDG